MLFAKPISNRICAQLKPLAIVSALLCVFAASVYADEPNLAKEEPAVVKSNNTELTEPVISAGEREHWSVKPLSRPELPAVKRGDWSRNEIDRFILAKLEAAGLSPLPEADPTTIIRRVTFDLTGLPPTPKEIDDFLADKLPDAYDKLLDRLLASTAYGEHWGQHWLDVARFAETDGYEYDKPRPQAWKYRDWVIDALNHDMPYSEFVRLQLAGDELHPDDESAAVATGFCLCGPDMPDINSQVERRHTVLNDLTSNVGSVFLGLQIGCAQCHDHKFDPISQADFYRLRACFEPAVTLKDTKIGRTLIETSAKTSPSYLWIRGDFRRQGAELGPGYPRIANISGDKVPQPAADGKSTGRRTALANWLTRADQPLATRVIINRLWQCHFGRGISGSPSDFGVMGQAPTHPELLNWLATELPRRDWSLKQMHRLMMTSATYRQASRATTPGWSTEQLAAAEKSWQQGKADDPDNRLLWHANRQRLEAEAIRDSQLAAADRLSSRHGGQGIMFTLPKELLATTAQGYWKTAADEEDQRRRSVYLFVSRNLRNPMLEVFDKPDTNASCPRRGRSTTAPQALTMLNSEFSLKEARELSGYVYQNGADGNARVTLAYRRVLGRLPTDDELKMADEFIAARVKAIANSKRATKDLPTALPLPDGANAQESAALSLFCLALFNSNEFLYVD